MSQVRSLSGPPIYKYKVYTYYLNKVTVLDYNFLSTEECNLLIEKVTNLKNKWQTSINYPYLNFLPFSLYSCQVDSYLKNVSDYNNLMYHNFADLYEKLKNKLSSQLNISLSWHNKLNYPGFHISNEKAMSYPNFHVDGFNQLNDIFKGKQKFFFSNDKILSVIVPISTSSEKDGLIYRNSKLPESKRKELIYDSFLPYKPGMLALWDGKVEHSMNPFPAHQQDKLRITLQCHIALSDKGYIFW